MGAEGYQHILVPLDGSKLSHTALEGALPIAHATGAKVTLISVVDRVLTHAFESYASSENMSIVDSVTAYLDGVCAELMDDGCNVDKVVRMATGYTVAERLIEIAGELDVDLIALSTHGRSGLGKALFGSVATAVLRDSPVPVLVFPQG